MLTEGNVPWLKLGVGTWSRNSFFAVQTHSVLNLDLWEIISSLVIFNYYSAIYRTQRT